MHPPQLQAIAAPCWKLNRGTNLRAPSLPKNFWHCAISDQGIRRAAAISFQFHLTCVSSLFSFSKLIPARMPIVSHWWLLNSCQVHIRAFWRLADNCFSTVCQNMDGPTYLLVEQRQTHLTGPRPENRSEARSGGKE